MIASCYRRDEAHNPELFADALALVLGDYPADIVRIAVDPRTGVIERFPMGLPNVGQIKQYLDDLLAKRDRLQHYASLPKAKPFKRALEKAEPNLFVPNDHRRYESMAKKAEKEPERARFENHLCADGVMRAGVWVPLDWFEALGERPQSARLTAAASAYFDKHYRADGVSLGGQPVSKELAAQIGARGTDDGADTRAA
jgi:hypothetical protein